MSVDRPQNNFNFPTEPETTNLPYESSLKKNDVPLESMKELIANYLSGKLINEKPPQAYNETNDGGFVRLSMKMNIVPKSDAESYYDRLKQFKDMLGAGSMPPLANGFSFVIDTRPPGHETETIPSLEYTDYFRNRQIPIAESGHRYRSHDEFHGPNYQTLFADALFADLVHGAATKAHGDADLRKIFTAAIDQFGDNMSSLERDDSVDVYYSGTTNKVYAVTQAEAKLRDLIDLDRPGDTAEDKEALFTELRSRLGLSGYEVRESLR